LQPSTAGRYQVARTWKPSPSAPLLGALGRGVTFRARVESNSAPAYSVIMTALVASPVRAGRNEREQMVQAYQQYLRSNDGELLPDGRSFSLREAAMDRLEGQQVRYRGPVDEALFRAGYHQRSPAAETPPELLLLLAFVKANAQEAFAVETITRVKQDLSPIERRVLTQENYHTRLLVGAADLYGVARPGPLPPTPPLRVLISAVAHSPAPIMHTLAVASEILGVAMFLRLLNVTRVTLKDHPELRDALEERLMQVCVDEIGHLSFNRLKVGRFGMAVARQLLPVLITAFRDTLPEMNRLAGGPLKVEDLAGLSFDQLPETARQKAFMA